VLEEVSFVEPEHHEHLEEHHDVQTGNSCSEHHRNEECTCYLCIPDLKLEFIARVHFFVVFLEDLLGLFHVASAFSIAASPAGRPGKQHVFSDMWGHNVHNHGYCQGGAHVTVPGDCEVDILPVQQGEISWYIELWDLGVNDQDQQSGVNELEEEDLRDTSCLLLCFILVSLEFASPD